MKASGRKAKIHETMFGFDRVPPDLWLALLAEGMIDRSR